MRNLVALWICGCFCIMDILDDFFTFFCTRVATFKLICSTNLVLWGHWFLRYCHRNRRLATARWTLGGGWERSDDRWTYPYCRIHVWYIELHSVDSYGKCREMYHTWILWDRPSTWFAWKRSPWTPNMNEEVCHVHFPGQNGLISELLYDSNE